MQVIDGEPVVVEIRKGAAPTACRRSNAALLAATTGLRSTNRKDLRRKPELGG
ncbi:hypothetical protein [Mesorhizobium sophorae]|uniref:hypothetical protein n=1 Tax=Mesorhizobium sophorae TaxID=1300294 RepID=UPI00142E1697|nr:hypothetical protein [Mesorhizobium sophorae]